ncbi:MAG TPA: helix-turn-helix domain-containing protein [Actinomycetota bacterium]
MILNESRFAAAVGRALRRARQSRGWTLREAAARSGSRFKPTSIAGYERGERAITVARFSDLCEVYGVEPDRLLAAVLKDAHGEPPAVIDLTRIEEMDEPEGRLVASFVREVVRLRGEGEIGLVTLRAGDLRVLATAAGDLADELEDRIRPALYERNGGTSDS